MASRSDKMYSDSPKVERGADGKSKVTRKSDGKKPEGKPDMDSMGGRHLRELKEMHKRHEDEHKAMNARHEQETSAAEPPDLGAAEPPPAA